MVKRIQKSSTDEKEKSWLLSHIGEVIQLGLLAVAILGLGATYRQLKQNDAHLRLSQRPWVGLGSFPTYQLYKIPGGSKARIPKIRFIWKNFGLTPALHVVGVPYVVLANHSMSGDEACQRVHAMANGTDAETGPLVGKMGTTLFPGQDTSMSDPNDDISFPETWAVNPQLFSIISCVAYEDQFGQEMETRVCHIVLPVKGAEPMIRTCAGGTGVR